MKWFPAMLCDRCYDTACWAVTLGYDAEAGYQRERQLIADTLLGRYCARHAVDHPVAQHLLLILEPIE